MASTKNDTIKIRLTPQLKQAYYEALELHGLNITEHLTQQIERLVKKKAKNKESAG